MCGAGAFSMVNTWVWLIFAVIVGQRLLELYVARQNRILALAAGAKEIGAGHYPLLVIMHGGWLAGWVIEATLYNSLSGIWYVWFGMFLGAQILRYWCIATLGRQWNTRILVIPGNTLIRRGPYRMLKHPNYLAVAVEFACVPMIFGAVTTAVLATIANAVLLTRIRIPLEEQALQLLVTAEIDE